MTAWDIDRRGLLTQLLTLIGAPVTAASLSACHERSRLAHGGVGRFFNEARMATLTDVIDLMIPHTDTAGAVDVGVPAFIDGLMADWAGPTARAQIGGVLEQADKIARAQAGGGYASLDRDGRLAALTALDARSFAAKDQSAKNYRLFKKIVFLAYATSETVLTTYVPNPGMYRGNLTRAEYDKLIAEKSVSAR